MDRRIFLKSCLAGAAAAAVWRPGTMFAADADTSAPSPSPPAQPAQLNLASQEPRLPGRTLKEKVANLVAFGGVGLEVMGNPANRIAEIKEAIKDTPVRISALCWGADRGSLVSTDEATRRAGVGRLKAALDTAAELDSAGVVFVPIFTRDRNFDADQATRILLDVLPEVGDHAQKLKTHVLIEPLNRAETIYINRIEQAVDICRRVNNPGIAVMGDFYHMGREEKCDEEAFVLAGPLMKHVHLGSYRRVLPGQDIVAGHDVERSFVAGFRGLQRIGYRGCCSLECGVARGTDPMQAIPESFRFLRRQWQEAMERRPRTSDEATEG